MTRVMQNRTVSIYALLNVRGDVRYIGKTVHSPDSRLNQHLHDAKARRANTRVGQWLRTLGAGCRPEVLVLEQVAEQSDWTSRESAWIAHYRLAGADLLNITSGGEGLSGLVPSLEHRDKISKAKRKGITGNCLHCKAETWRRPSQVARGQKLYCGAACYHQASIGRTTPMASHLVKAECKHGHPLSGNNVYLNRAGSRVCKTCLAARKAEFMRGAGGERERAAQKAKRSTPEYKARLNARLAEARRRLKGASTMEARRA